MSPMRSVPFRPGFDHAVDAAPGEVEARLGTMLAEDPGLAGKTLSDPC